MNQRRLRWLLAVMCVLAVVRVLVPNTPVQRAVSEADVRPARSAPTGAAVTLAPQPTAVPDTPTTETDTPGNAFAVRRLAVAVIALAPTPTGPKLAVGGLPPPLPQVADPPAQSPPPPFHVIGTWDDGVAPGLFVSTPMGTLLAHQGTVLLAEYRVTSITAQLLSLEHLASKREYRLDVPRGASK